MNLESNCGKRQRVQKSGHCHKRDQNSEYNVNSESKYGDE